MRTNAKSRSGDGTSTGGVGWHTRRTNADSTRGALAGAEGVFWILGGKEKDGGVESLRPFFGNIAKAYLIGQSTDLFAASLDGAVIFERCGTLDVAVAKAAVDAAASVFEHPLVLLSPACASYDQYKTFEHRGRHFCELVSALADFKPVSGE